MYCNFAPWFSCLSQRLGEEERHRSHNQSSVCKKCCWWWSLFHGQHPEEQGGCLPCCVKKTVKGMENGGKGVWLGREGGKWSGESQDTQPGIKEKWHTCLHFLHDKVPTLSTSPFSDCRTSYSIGSCVFYLFFTLPFISGGPPSLRDVLWNRVLQPMRSELPTATGCHRQWAMCYHLSWLKSDHLPTTSGCHFPGTNSHHLPSGKCSGIHSISWHCASWNASLSTFDCSGQWKFGATRWDHCTPNYSETLASVCS